MSARLKIQISQINLLKIAVVEIPWFWEILFVHLCKFAYFQLTLTSLLHKYRYQYGKCTNFVVLTCKVGGHFIPIDAFKLTNDSR